MVEYDRGTLVLLHLASIDPSAGERAPYEATAGGIMQSLGVGERFSERVSLVSSLSNLQSDGLVTERVAHVPAYEDERNVYSLTPAGRERAASVRDRLESAEIVVRTDDGAERTVELGAIDEFADHFDGDPLVGALAALTDEDVLYLGESPGDGMVDREAELATVETALDAVADGEDRTILLTGDVGTGKTTLLDAVESMADDRGFATLVGRCDRSGNRPYGPFRSMVEDIDGAPFGGEEVPVDDAEGLTAKRQALFHDVAATVGDWAGSTPLAILVDDLQWADEPTVELFRSLAESDRTGPVAVVGTARPGAVTGDHPLASALESERRDPTRIEVGPLDRADTDELVRRTVGSHDVPASFVAALYRETDGNPLFVRETVGHLLEAGTVDPDLGVYPADPDDIEFPDRVQTAIERRLSGLDETGRAILEAGAMVGEEVPFSLLAAVVDVARSELRDYVDVLVGSAVWRRRAPNRPDEGVAMVGPSIVADGGAVYQFTSGAMRSAVHASIPADRKRRLHRRIAEAIVSTGGTLDAECGTVADHYERAGDHDRAVEFYRRAGEYAESVYAHETAIDAYGSALELAREHDHPREEVWDLLTAMAEAHRLLGEYDLASRRLRYVLERTDDADRERRLYHDLAEIANDAADHRQAIAHAEDGLELGDDADAATCRLLHARGWGHLRLGETDDALASFERAAAVADRIDDDAERARATYDRGAALLVQGSIDRAADVLEDAIEATEAAGVRQTHVYAVNDLAIARQKQGDVETALELNERCLDLRREYGDVQGECTSYVNLGSFHFRRRDLETAMGYYEKGLAVAERIGARDRAAALHLNVAFWNYLRGNLDVALDEVAAARELNETVENPRRTLRANRIESLVAFFLADFDRAERLADEERDVARRVGDHEALAKAETFLGILAHERGDLDAAREYHERALATSVEHGHDAQAARCRDRLLRVLADQGDLDAATDPVEKLEAWNDRADWQSRNRIGLGYYYRAAGDDERSADVLDAALAASREATERVYESIHAYELAVTARDRGDHDAAREYAETSRSIADESGMVLYVRKCDELLAILDHRE